MTARLRWLLPLLLLAAAFAYMYIRFCSHGHGYFRYPVDQDLQLAANFGELREDHFHMGLDIRTMGREGLPVYAAADGFISRIEIKADGLGHALYIQHPNGMTTAYGHLSSFVESVETFTRSQQYQHESWDQRIDIPADRWPVKKGDLIAYSGNTGASRAPHLHFEVMDTKTGRHLNPQLLGFEVEDRLPPAINALYWYDRTVSTYSSRAHKIALNTKDIIRVSSPIISLGIQATDKTSSSSHVSGIYAASLKLDDSLILDYSLDDCMPDDTRYINACIDYTKWVRSHIYVTHLSVLPGNRSHAYTASHNGLIRLADSHPHRISIKVRDVAGNTSSLDLTIQYSGNKNAVYAEQPAGVHYVIPGRETTLRGSASSVHFGAAAFYDEVPFRFEEFRGPISPVVYLHDATVPVHDAYTVMLQTTLSANSHLRQQTVLQLVSGDSQYIVKGVWQEGRLTGRFNRLGIVQALVDTIAPVAVAKGWTDAEPLPAGAASLSIVCRDDLGPIGAFRGEIDGHWIPFAPHGDTYTYTIDAHCAKGTHRLRIKCSDVAGNQTIKEYTIIVE